MSEENKYMLLESKVLDVLKTIYDPEIPVNIYELGLIYEINIDEASIVHIKMTLTAPNCPVAETLPQEVIDKVKAIDGVLEVDLQLVFDPPWNKDMMSDAAQLELGLF